MQSPDYMESTLPPSSVASRNPVPLALPRSYTPAARTPTTPVRTPGGTSRTNLFIRYLPKEVDDEELLRLFEPFGVVATSMVMRDIHTGESLGTAFVRYESPRDAETAKRAMDQLHLYNKKLSIQWARREHDFKTANNDLNKKQMYKLFLRNVPMSTTTEELGRLLSPYGTVIAVSIHADTQQTDANADGASNAPHPRIVSPTAEVGGARTPPGATPTRRIAFVTFAEDGSAERALRGVHHTCPLPDCDGIPFMGKLINDNLLSKKQQQQQFYNTPRSTHPSLSLGALSIASGQSPTLPSPASSQGHYTTPSRQHSFARSPTTSQGNVSTTDFACGDGVMYAAHGGLPPRGNSFATDGFYPAYSGSVTPTSEATSVTPRLGLTAGGDIGNGYNIGQSMLKTNTMVPPHLSQHSLQSNNCGTNANGNMNVSSQNEAASSQCSSTPIATATTPSRTRRYTHNPYAALVIQ